MGFFRKSSPVQPDRSFPPALFAVVDLETTGLVPQTERIVEVAVVRMDAAGTIHSEWTTLVRPEDGRGAGKTSIHGIESEWLRVAPTFSEIAGDLFAQISGCILVAHNASFDVGFLEYEYRRAGYEFGAKLPALDTMEIAGLLGLPRRLSALADYLGISYEAHNALEDARATAKVLEQLLRYIDPATLTNVDPRVPSNALPPIPASGLVALRAEARELTTVRPILDDILAQLPPPFPGSVRDERAATAYLGLLEEVMADGVVTPAEAQQIREVASAWGLSRADVETLNRDFLARVVDAALDDRTISKAEKAEIDRVATWRGIEIGDLDTAIKEGRARLKEQTKVNRAEVAGMEIAFTGRGVYSNSLREGLCLKYKIQFVTRIGPQTDALVVGAEDTENATVAAALSGNLPVMVESAFWMRLGEKIPKAK